MLAGPGRPPVPAAKCCCSHASKRSAQTGGLFVDVVSRSCIFVSETLHERFAIRRNNDCAECSEVVRSVAKVAAAERNAELQP